MASVDKVWTELAYEAARVEFAPDRPSRLDALYAYADPLEAFSFTEETDQPKAVWEGAVQDDVVWAIVDMSSFHVVRAEVPEQSSYEDAWSEAFEDAKLYWASGNKPQVAEVLVGGPILLSRRLQLIPILRELHVID